MKKALLLIIGFIVTTNLLANPINPEQPATLFNHLIEINQEWSKHYSPSDFNEIYSFENDDQRIQMHLKLVEKHLRQNIPTRLNVDQIRNRSEALDILKIYYENSCFPENHYHPSRQPYFIDNYGTACAVGQLVIETGFETLAQQISKENNYAYIRDLELEYPELGKWAKKFGFTLAELAWVQPTYPTLIETWNQVGNGGGVDGIINKIKAYDDEVLYIGGDFTEIDGVAANSIITWDGNDWSTLGNGVTGEIFDIAFSQGRVYIVGDFYVNDKPEIINIAFWKNGEWNGFETSSMDGVVYTIQNQSNFDLMYIGGSFEIADTNGNLISNLAKIKISTGLIHNDDGAFSVNGVVTDFEKNGSNILVAGDFTETAPLSTDSLINHLVTKHIAYWNSSEKNWVLGFEHDVGPISSVLIKDGYIYTAARQSLSPPIDIGIYGAGLWDYHSNLYSLDTTQSEYIKGITTFDDYLIFYGNIWSYYILGISYGIDVFNPYGGRKKARFDGPVNAAERFQNQLYFAGDFTSVNDQGFSGLVSTPFDDPSTANVELNQPDQLNVYSSPSQIQVRYEALDENFELFIYNLNGQLINQNMLPQGTGEISVSIQQWSAGIYVYQAISKSGKRYSGKVSIIR